MRDESGEKARSLYQQVHQIVAGRPIPNWDVIRERHGMAAIEAARAEYNSNPVVVDLRKCEGLGWMRNLTDFAVSEGEYIGRARDNAVATFAVVRDGKWYERGSMGWFGYVSDEKDDATWLREFSQLLDGLPDDTLLTLVDCHI